MGFLSFNVYLCCNLVVSVLTCTFELWVLRFVYQTASFVVSGRGLEHQYNDDVLLPCVFKRFSSKKVTMACTVASIACFFAASVIKMLSYIVHLSHDCQKEEDIFRMTVHLCTFWENCGYLFMFVTHFERLRLTFRGTVMRLPPSAPNLLYALLLLTVFTMTAFAVFRFSAPIISALSLALIILMYFASVSALIRAFFKKTMAIAAMNLQNNGDVIQTAVRVTVSVTTSLLSTTLVLLLWVVVFSMCPQCMFWMFVGNTLLFFDMCLNAFCLMCTFGRAEGYYQRVFGRLHRTFMRHLPEAEVELDEFSGVSNNGVQNS